MSQGSDRTIEQRLRAAVESAPSGLLMVDARGRIVLVNREIERMFGYSRDELLGESVERLVPGRFREHHPAFRQGFMHEPRARAMGAGRDLYGRRKDGSEVPVEIGLNPVETDEGMFVLGSIVDISARKAAEAERRQLERQLRQSQKLEAVGTLAGGIAHDFNNILGAIIGYAELIEAEVGARSDLDDLVRQADRGRSLVERLLSFSRQSETDRRTLDLGATVEETRRLLRATLPATIEIGCEVSDGLLPILGDATGIQQILLNLGNNAAYAMPGGGRLEIRVDPLYVRDSVARTHPILSEGPHLVLSVADDGNGMPPRVRERALEPFFTTKPPGEGTGLGLAMVLGIVREHEGAVELESEEGSGTTVRCIFPALLTGAVTGDLVPTELPRGDGRRVLYVDDEPALAAVGARRLEWLGYEVVASTVPTEALALFREDPTRYDVVVTDLSMPGIDGIELARSVGALAPGTPVLLLSGFLNASAVERAKSAGIRRVVQKPLTIAEFAQAVASVLDPDARGGN